jgi:hypothetical protein
MGRLIALLFGIRFHQGLMFSLRIKNVNKFFCWMVKTCQWHHQPSVLSDIVLPLFRLDCPRLKFQFFEASLIIRMFKNFYLPILALGTTPSDQVILTSCWISQIFDQHCTNFHFFLDGPVKHQGLHPFYLLPPKKPNAEELFYIQTKWFWTDFSQLPEFSGKFMFSIWLCANKPVLKIQLLLLNITPSKGLLPLLA